MTAVLGSQSESFLRYNDQDGNRVISLNKDGSVTYGDGTTQSGAASGSSFGPYPNDGRTIPTCAGFQGGSQGNVTSTAPTGAPNTVWVSREFFVRTFNWVSIAISIATAAPSSKYYVGLYQYDGLVGAGKLLASVVFPTTSTGRQVFNLNTPYLVTPGMYWMAYSSDSSSTVMIAPFWDGFQSRWETAIATNPVANGALPPTLGALTYNVLGSGPWLGMKSDSIIN